MSERDPLEVFSRVNPFAGEVDASTEADEARLLSIIATPVTAGGRRPSRRRLVVVVGVGVVVVATAAFALLRREQASDPTGVACFATADLNADIVVLGPSPDPVAACATVWSDGRLSADGPPQLTACVNDSGVASVFPGDPSVCSELGLAELVPGRSAEHQAIVDLQQRMAEFYSADCYRQPEALATAQQLLDESGLTGWSVQLAEDFPPGFECGIATPLADARTVIVGGGRPAP